jgi:glyoxylase-like metal-dependent hydrolase (beta-lactamase superfamily II)
MLAYHIESEGRRLLIWADSCVHYVMAIQRPDWHHDVDDDKDQAAATRRSILSMAAAERLFVAGYHMPFPGPRFHRTIVGRLSLGAGQLSAQSVRPRFCEFLAGPHGVPRRAA